MKKLIRFIKQEKGIGLVEALISIGIVGSGMVVITFVSFKSIRRAKSNELKDIAVQASVEAMDFMKQPGNVEVSCFSYTGAINESGENNASIILDNVDGPLLDATKSGASLSKISCASNPCSGKRGSITSDEAYRVNSISDNEKTLFCRQILVTGTQYNLDIEVRTTWETVGGECREYILEGRRIGKITCI